MADGFSSPYLFLLEAFRLSFLHFLLRVQGGELLDEFGVVLFANPHVLIDEGRPADILHPIERVPGRVAEGPDDLQLPRRLWSRFFRRFLSTFRGIFQLILLNKRQESHENKKNSKKKLKSRRKNSKKNRNWREKAKKKSKLEGKSEKKLKSGGENRKKIEIRGEKAKKTILTMFFAATSS